MKIALNIKSVNFQMSRTADLETWGTALSRSLTWCDARFDSHGCQNNEKLSILFHAVMTTTSRICYPCQSVRKKFIISVTRPLITKLDVFCLKHVQHQRHLISFPSSSQRKPFNKGLFTWRWGTPGRWGNPPSRGRKMARVYMQTYNPGVPGWRYQTLLRGR